MVTQDEIVARLNDTKFKQDDFFGFQTSDMLSYLDFEHARPWLKDEATPDKWKTTPLTPEAVKAEIVGYLPFAWEKATNHRGLSASRSIEHMRAWLWLLGDTEALDYIGQDENWGQYGAKCLKYIGDRYGFAMPDDDAARRMADGEPCMPGCDMGCGR